MINILLTILVAGGNMTEQNSQILQFNFSQLQNQQHLIVNDGVMGGRSDSELTVGETSASYQGNVSLENNGGFASVRMIWPFDMANTEHEPAVAVLKVKGDGKVYQFRLRTDRGFDGAAYSYSFKTLQNKEQTIYIPINDFEPTFRGRTLRNMPKLEFSDVQQMGILIADAQVGQFNIELIELSLK